MCNFFTCNTVHSCHICYEFDTIIYMNVILFRVFCNLNWKRDRKIAYWALLNTNHAHSAFITKYNVEHLLENTYTCLFHIIHHSYIYKTFKTSKSTVDTIQLKHFAEYKTKLSQRKSFWQKCGNLFGINWCTKYRLKSVK